MHCEFLTVTGPGHSQWPIPPNHITYQIEFALNNVLI